MAKGRIRFAREFIRLLLFRFYFFQTPAYFLTAGVFIFTDFVPCLYTGPEKTKWVQQNKEGLRFMRGPSFYMADDGGVIRRPVGFDAPRRFFISLYI